jgi:NAD(P)-dependent dehydrogenase (short-subunit alcohol dehydrogenase family)
VVAPIHKKETDMQIANHVFIVTGAGSGLGAATAQRLVDQAPAWCWWT